MRTARPAILPGLLIAASLALGGCGLFEAAPRAKATPKRVAEAEEQTPLPVPPATLGKGPVKVALVLPLTAAGSGAATAASLRNAAELALSEFDGAPISLMVEDDRGTADGARQAAQTALAGGAELVLGPLFAPAVTAAAAAARPAGRPLIAFSTDVTVAGRGVYLLSFLPQAEVERVLDYAAAQGKRSVAALVPETPYGAVSEGQFRAAASRLGLKVAAVERYVPGEPGPAIARIAPAISGATPQADALFLPESGEGIAEVAASLQSWGFNPARVKPLGTGLWNDPRVLKAAALQGGWFAAPDSAGFAAFAGRYRARFGQEPARVATLAYDAVSLAAALARAPAKTRFTDATLQNPAGFAGADGIFRFRADGTSDRALAVFAVRSGAAAVASPAPKSFASGT